jgi:4-carboxymuconolactone decarboxylase
MDRDLFEKGLAQRKATLGAEYVEKNLAAADGLTRPFQEAMTAWCWGFGWGDDAIDPKTRSLMNLAMIGALGKMHEWEIHCRGALNNGVTPEQIRADHPCRRHLLRRAAGAGVLPRGAQGAGGGGREPVAAALSLRNGGDQTRSACGTVGIIALLLAKFSLPASRRRFGGHGPRRAAGVLPGGVNKAAWSIAQLAAQTGRAGSPPTPETASGRRSQRAAWRRNATLFI